MILFLTDAAALVRIYLCDIGTANVRQIYNYPSSRIVTASIVPGAVLDTMLSAYNHGLLNAEQYHHVIGAFEADLYGKHIRVLNLTSEIVACSRALLLKHRTAKRVEERHELSHDAATCLATALRLADLSQAYGGRVTLITADMALYNAALAEPAVGAFHFWTCNMGCLCDIGIIPVRGKPGQINACPSCGKTCPECGHLVCPSTYSVNFGES